VPLVVGMGIFLASSAAAIYIVAGTPDPRAIPDARLLTLGALMALSAAAVMTLVIYVAGTLGDEPKGDVLDRYGRSR
jgi:hypothetical protein